MGYLMRRDLDDNIDLLETYHYSDGLIIERPSGLDCFPLLFPVYNDLGELCNVARVDAMSLIQPYLNLEFIDVTLSDLSRGIPVFSRAKFFLHNDNTFSVDFIDPLFLLVYSGDNLLYPMTEQGCWIFRLLPSLSTRFPLANLDTWCAYLKANKAAVFVDKAHLQSVIDNRLLKAEQEFANLCKDTEDERLRIIHSDYMLHISDMPEYARYYNICRDYGLVLNDKHVFVLNDIIPSKICYLPEIVGKFDITLPPSVGSEGIILNKTAEFGTLTVQSDKGQSRSINLSNTSVKVCIRQGNINMVVAEDCKLDIIASDNDAFNLRSESNAGDIEITNCTSGGLKFRTSAEINAMTLENCHLNYLTATHIDSLFLVDTAIEEEIRTLKSSQILLDNCSIKLGLVSTESFSQRGGDLALSESSDIQRLTLRDVNISEQHHICNVSSLSLYIGSCHFEKNGVLSIAPETKKVKHGISCACLTLQNFNYAPEQKLNKAELVAFPYHVFLDLRAYATPEVIMTLKTLSLHSLLLDKHFRSFINSVRIIANSDVSVTLSVDCVSTAEEVFQFVCSEVSSDSYSENSAKQNKLDLNEVRDDFFKPFKNFVLHNPDVKSLFHKWFSSSDS